MKLWRFIVSSILSMGLVGPAWATAILPPDSNTGVEHIANLNTKIHVDRHNVADITETITYDFGQSNHHGIYRIVPLQYKSDDNKTFYIGFTDKGVSMDGGSVPVNKSAGWDQEQLKIGDPNNTISGVHTYVIHYQLSPLVIQKGGRDFLTLDAVGTGWTVPITQASASFEFDGGQLSEAHCYAGPLGSTTENCELGRGTPSTYTANQLGLGSGMTVVGYLPNGYVDHYLKTSLLPPLTSELLPGFLAISGGTLAALLVGLGFFGRWWRERRRKKHQTIVAQYESPDDLMPAEIGLLEDDSASIREITATMIDLAVRGYLKIEQTQKKTIFRKADYKLSKLKDYGDVQDYERDLLDTLLGGQESVQIRSVNTTSMSLTVSKIKTILKQRLTEKGYYGTMKDQRGLWDKVVDTGTVTDTGAAEWAKVEGFKLYLGVAEKARLNFSDAPEKTPERFNKLLPYAVALGVEKEWAKQFEGIDVSQQSSWYVSNYGAWTAFALADDLSSGFAGAVGDNFVASSRGSGGSVGGGFGGGGGGSW